MEIKNKISDDSLYYQTNGSKQWEKVVSIYCITDYFYGPIFMNKYCKFPSSAKLRTINWEMRVLFVFSLYYLSTHPCIHSPIYPSGHPSFYLVCGCRFMWVVRGQSGSLLVFCGTQGSHSGHEGHGVGGQVSMMAKRLLVANRLEIVGNE